MVLGAEVLPAEGAGLWVAAEVPELELPLGTDLPQADRARARAASTSGAASSPSRPFPEDLPFIPHSTRARRRTDEGDPSIGAEAE
jgi:hypothetical protein